MSQVLQVFEIVLKTALFGSMVVGSRLGYSRQFQLEPRSEGFGGHIPGDCPSGVWMILVHFCGKGGE
jgi:hypothetical protein